MQAVVTLIYRVAVTTPQEQGTDILNRLHEAGYYVKRVGPEVINHKVTDNCFLVGELDLMQQVTDARSIEESLANARIMAAGLDLLAACEAVLAATYGARLPDAVVSQVEAAIAKAKGVDYE